MPGRAKHPPRSVVDLNSLPNIKLMHLFPNAPRRILFFLGASVLLSLFVAGCKSSKPAAGGADRLPQALLWKVEGNGLVQPSYVFGTIHIMPEADYFYPSGFDAAFDQAGRIVFEIDLKEMDDLGSMMNMITGMMMKGNTTLDDLLTPEEYREVSDYFDELGLPMFLLNKVKPMFLSVFAEMDTDPSALGGEGMLSYEMELNDRAEAEGKQTGGLETMAYQMSLFDSIPYTEQAKMLVEAIRGAKVESDVYQETVKLYTEQRIEDMVEMIGEADRNAGDAGHYEDVLLVNRNRNWIPVMGRMMQKEAVLFAVGAGHLGGDTGIIRLLRQAGYTVSPVSIYKPGAKQI
jgi:uncharacterized protein YbaP (TraB family)